MILCVDGTVWGGAETGVSSLTRRLIHHLAVSGGPEELRVFLPRRARDVTETLQRSPKTHVVWTADVARGSRVAWQQLVLPGRIARSGPDLLYCPCYTVPQLVGVATIVTIHDLIVWKRPDLCSPANVLHFRLLVGRSARRARAITVPTEAVKRDVVGILGVPESKVVVVPWGVDFPPEDKVTARRLVRERYGIETPFALLSGGHDPKKNLDAARLAIRDLELDLVVIGPPPRAWDARKRLAPSGGRWEIDLGYVPDATVPTLHAAAEVLLCPSHIEGFGAPALEAMGCGTPVIASDDPALVETCGGAALHVPPGEPDALAAAVRRVREDSAVREWLVQRGLERASHFSWDRSVRMFRLALDLALRG